jgi:hypothetical protein
MSETDHKTRHVRWAAAEVKFKRVISKMLVDNEYHFGYYPDTKWLIAESLLLSIAKIAWSDAQDSSLDRPSIPESLASSALAYADALHTPDGRARMRYNDGDGNFFVDGAIWGYAQAIHHLFPLFPKLVSESMERGELLSELERAWEIERKKMGANQSEVRNEHSEELVFRRAWVACLKALDPNAESQIYRDSIETLDREINRLASLK